MQEHERHVDLNAGEQRREPLSLDCEGDRPRRVVRGDLDRSITRTRTCEIDLRLPRDCVDGFFHSYWRRLSAYLQEPVRRGSSVWARIG